MNLSKLFYKINNENVKKFEIINFKNVDIYYIVKNFSNISVNEIVKLLENDKKIIIADNAIVCMEKITNVKNKLNDDKKFSNLLISKEAYIKTVFHEEYSNLLHSLEIFNAKDSDAVVRSDIALDLGIKFSYFSVPDYLLKVVDGSLFTKKIVFEKFGHSCFDLKEIFDEIINFGHEIKNNLIISSNMFVEKISSDSNMVCNIFDIENDFHPEIKNVQRWGIISPFDFIDSSRALTTAEMKKIPKDIKKEFKKMSWIDLVSIKHNLKKQNITNVIFQDIEYYDDLDEIKVCSANIYSNEMTKSFIDKSSSNMHPLFTKFKGWKKDTQQITEYNDIPSELLDFLKWMKNFLDINRVVVRLKEFEIAI